MIDANQLLLRAISVAETFNECESVPPAKPGLIYALISLYPNIDPTKCGMNYSIATYIYYIINAYILDKDISNSSKYLKSISAPIGDFLDGAIIADHRALSLYYRRYDELPLPIQSIIFALDDPITILSDQPVEFRSDALLFLFSKGKQPKIDRARRNKYSNYLILLTYHDMVRPIEEHLVPLHRGWINDTIITSHFDAVSQCIALTKSIEEFDELLMQLSKWNIIISNNSSEVVEIALSAYNSPLAGPIVAKSFIDRYLNDQDVHTHIPFSALDSPERIDGL